MPHVLGAGQPDTPLIVSPQHRIAVGASGQLAEYFDAPGLVPAKSLVGLPGVRFMHWIDRVNWVHFACASHAVVCANGAAAESLLLGPFICSELSDALWDEVRERFGAVETGGALNGPPAFPCLRNRPTRQRIFGHADPAVLPVRARACTRSGRGAVQC